MANDQNLTSYKPGQSGNLSGKPKGIRNRATVAREVLDLIGSVPDKLFDKLALLYPGITKEMSIEQIMTLAQAHKAIARSDTYAYNSLLDSAHGKAITNISVDPESSVNIQWVNNFKPPEKEETKPTKAKKK